MNSGNRLRQRFASWWNVAVIGIGTAVIFLSCFSSPRSMAFAGGKQGLLPLERSQKELEDRIPLRITEDKPGLRQFPGFSTNEMEYNYDALVSTDGNLRLFTLRRHLYLGSDGKRTVQWTTRFNVFNKQPFPILNRLYRWNGEKSELVLEHGQEDADENPDNMVERIPVFRSVTLGLPDKEGTGMRIDVLEIPPVDTSDSASINMKVLVHKDRPVYVSKAALKQGTTECQMRLGEHIENEFIDMELVRIVNRNDADHNPGWAEFIATEKAKLK